MCFYRGKNKISELGILSRGMHKNWLIKTGLLFTGLLSWKRLDEQMKGYPPSRSSASMPLCRKIPSRHLLFITITIQIIFGVTPKF